MIFGLSLFELILLLYALYPAVVILISFPLFGGFPRMADETPEETPMVSIILPVRNQESSVARCVESLIAQDYSNKEVIVVEGGSEDDTEAILRRYDGDIKLLTEPPLPKGWVGKNWACHQGYLAAQGDFLLFTDGDTVHHPSLVRKAVAYLTKEKLDLVTLASHLSLESFWEKAILPLILYLIGVTHRGRWVNRDDKRWVAANGQFLLFKRSAYEEIGGHEGVRDRVEEDFRLGLAAKRGGHRLRMVDGRDELEVRMYTSLREIWHGWLKNIFPAMDFSLQKAGRNVAGLFLLLILPFLLLGWALILLPSQGFTLLLYVAGFLSGLIWLRLALAHALFGGKARYALTTPIGAAIILALIVDSARRYLRKGGVGWKGRTYGIPET